MLRLTAVCLLLTCALSLSSSAVFLENGMPIKWNEAAEQLTDLPAQDGLVTPDPWNFIHRMGLYRVMIAATDQYMSPMGAGPTESPLWGLPVLLGWMKTSGRLADPTHETTCGQQMGNPLCISPQSWWACVNYFLSAIPFLSAAHRGLLGEGVRVEMQVPAGVEEYCTTHAACTTKHADLMAKWDAFFQGLKTLTGSVISDNEKKDSILDLYWKGHLASLSASAQCNPKKSHYSSPEVSFASNWLTPAEFALPAKLHTNLQISVLFLSPMPSRLLREGDLPGSIAGLSGEENHAVFILSWIKTANTILGGALLRLWSNAMCSVDARERGREMLEQLLLNPHFATGTLLTISNFAKNCEINTLT